ncbi:MAG TPA: ribokinase [Solirubrobacteraceae bacterium]|nr:ribokinase [Solirubrobacteraceae bacterium]
MSDVDAETRSPAGSAADGAAASLVVVGSCNMDLTAHARRLPRPGETLIAHGFTQRAGGKGANQAVAAARQGLAVSLVSAVGDDVFGETILEVLREEGVEVGRVATVPGSSGIALIVVDDEGEDTIVVSPGAGQHVSVEDCDLAAPNAVLAQLEIPIGVVGQAAQRTAGMFCLNASPYAELGDELVECCDLIIVNRSEYELGRAELDHARLLCVTLGADGAKLMRCGREVASATSPEVRAVDTVGAGDAFVGALVAEILRGGDPEAALEVACRAGALATTQFGAQAALPYREELT